MPWYVTLPVVLEILGVPAIIIGWFDLSKRLFNKDIGKRSRYLIGVFGMVVAAGGLVIAVGGQVGWFNAGKPEIRITSPLSGISVSQNITVEGYATSELCENQHLYIVVEYGGRWWPQYSEIILGYSAGTKKWEFSTPASIGLPEDVGKSFTIRAILADPAIHQHFQSWLQQSTTAENWTGIPIAEADQIGKRQICDSITVTRR
jgi:hypothetical protein